jgi:hypothetical protein
MKPAVRSVTSESNTGRLGCPGLTNLGRHMELKEAFEQLSGVMTRQPNLDLNLLVMGFRPCNMGGTPCEIQIGIDSGKPI